MTIAVCVERHIRRRATLWLIDDKHLLLVEQHISPDPWHLYRQQHSYCTVHECDTAGVVIPKRNRDVPTSSHAEAITQYICYINRKDQSVEISYNV